MWQLSIIFFILAIIMFRGSYFNIIVSISCICIAIALLTGNYYIALIGLIPFALRLFRKLITRVGALLL